MKVAVTGAAALERMRQFVNTYGTQEGPLCAYLYDLSELRQHVRRVMACLPAGCEMFYAMKANANPRLLQVIGEYVHGLETASIGEVRKARSCRADLPVLFGGPGKTEDELAEAIRLQVRHLHVESLHELRRVEQIAAHLGRRVNVLIRINLRGPLPAATLQMGGKATQFGLDESLLGQATAILHDSPHVQFEGFHLHSVSNQLDAQAHLQLIDHYIAKVREWSYTYGLQIKLVNVGGGIGVNYRDLDSPFAWEAFCAQLGPLLRKKADPAWKLVFECGRFLVASCGAYAAEVIDVKENHGQAFAIVRGGTHHFRLPASWQHNHPFEIVAGEDWPYPFPRMGVACRPVTIAGQLCTPKDVFAQQVPVDEIRIGDVVLFRYAGAYGWEISHHEFLSHPHPAMIYLEDSEPE